MIVCRSMIHFVPGNVTNGNGSPVFHGDAPLDPSSFVMVRFDSRPLTNTSYWYTSAHWNWRYARRHGHRFVSYSYPSLDESSQAASADGRIKCVSHDQQSILSDPWCKVQTMLQAQEDYPDARFFLYVDNGAVISKHFAHLSLLHLVGNFRHWLNWTMEEKPIIFNQDGPSWWCNLVTDTTNYTWCLNSGTVFWHRSHRATAVLEEWWMSSTDPYETDPFKFRFRTEWPWEQDRQMAIANRNDTVSSYVLISSQPQQVHMDMDRGRTHWCFSHLEQSNCFISHYCENVNMKEKMRNLYSITPAAAGETMYFEARFPRSYLGTHTLNISTPDAINEWQVRT